MNASLKTETLSLPVELPFRYRYRPPTGDEAEVFVLLHGFAETGDRILASLAPLLPAEAAIIAPDGPFPVPRRKRDGTWAVGFSWYFWRSEDRSFYIDMTGALDLLAASVEREGLGGRRKRVIGFSQGGWLAPALGLRLAHVSQAICVGSEYAIDRTPPPFPFRIDGVHGENDDIVPIAGARRTHTAFAHAGARGQFIEVSQGTHGFDEAMLAGVQQALALGSN